MIDHKTRKILEEAGVLYPEVKPTVDTADFVRVVRCKDCKWHQDEEIGMVYCPYIIGSWVNENSYCDRGERKEDG